MTLAGRRLLILTEGGRRKGLGHVVRCGAYAEAWMARGGEAAWIIDGDDLALAATRDLGSVQVRSWLGKADAFAQGADALVIDSYAIEAFEAAQLAGGEAPAAFVDDLRRIAYERGLVVNAVPRIEPPPSDGAEWLVGPDWQPLRRAFRDVPQRPSARAAIGRVLVIMGGTDARDLGVRTAAIASQIFPKADIRLVGADTAPAGARALGRLSADDMRREMSDCDLAISAAGQTLWELARCGAPTVMVGVADNQRLNRQGWPGLVGFVDAGVWDDPDFAERLAQACKILRMRDERSAVSVRAQAAVDGLGAVRLIDRLELAITGALTVDGLSLAPFARLSEEERRCVWRMRIHPEVSRWMATGGDISWETHVRFMDGQAADTRNLNFLARDSGGAVGVVSIHRIDRRTQTGELGLYRNPERSERGLGRRLLEAICGVAFDHEGLRTFTLDVRCDNAAAIALYTRIGFRDTLRSRDEAMIEMSLSDHDWRGRAQ